MSRSFHAPSFPEGPIVNFIGLHFIVFLAWAYWELLLFVASKIHISFGG